MEIKGEEDEQGRRWTEEEEGEGEQGINSWPFKFWLNRQIIEEFGELIDQWGFFAWMGSFTRTVRNCADI